MNLYVYNNTPEISIFNIIIEIRSYYIPEENDPIYPVGTCIKIIDDNKKKTITGIVTTVSDDKQNFLMSVNNVPYERPISVYEKIYAKPYKPKKLSEWRRNLKICDLVDVYAGLDRQSDWFLAHIISVNEETGELSVKIGDTDQITTFPVQSRSFAPAYSQSKGKLNHNSASYHPMFLYPIKSDEEKGIIAKRDEDFYSDIYYHVVNCFFQSDGINKLFSFLKKNDNHNNLFLSTSLFACICRVMSNSFVEKYLEIFINELSKLFFAIPLDQLRNISIVNLHDFLLNIMFINYRMVYYDDSYLNNKQMIIENIYQKFLPRFLSSPSLETRLNAFQCLLGTLLPLSERSAVYIYIYI